MLGNTSGRNRAEYVPEYVVFDLETTGISAVSDQIIEIAAIKVQNDQPVKEFSSLVNPGCGIPPAATRVNGITDDLVAPAPAIEKVLPDFLEFIGALPLVGHNIHSFDMKFIDRECSQLYGKAISNDHIDTLTLAKICLPNLSHYRLTDLASHFMLSTKGAHRALNDCRMNREIYELLGKEIQKSAPELSLCPRCGSLLKKRNGKFGSFWGCSSFPDCRYTRNL